MFGQKSMQPKGYLSAIIVAAGSGTRMEGADKQLTLLGDYPIVVWSIMPYQISAMVDEIILVCKENQLTEFFRFVKEYNLSKVTQIVSGGIQRQDSVFCGINACNEAAEFFLIHDGARPFITENIIENCVSDAFRYGAAAVGVPVKDTVKIVGNGVIKSTPRRESLVAIQTPQIFSAEVYRRAMRHAVSSGVLYTDDCALFEEIGEDIHVTMGSYENIKITTPEDLIIARAILLHRDEEEQNGRI